MTIVERLKRLSILRFAVIGALGMPVDWSVLQLMVHLGSGPYLGRLLSWFCAATFTWTGNRYFTFAATRARGFLATGREWLRFLAANAVGGLVNVGLYSVLVRFAPPPLNDLTVALVFGVLLGLAFNFTLSKKVVFKGPI
ncbi:MAG: GtrA family protein [Alphaproteobacteria bacterium]|nr:GtrA family protein [Alphaproteobacteria bacterium]